METIRIIITGGTFDKHYDPLKGELTFKETHLPQILKQVRCTVPYVLEIDQLIDSLEMGDASRQGIREACRAAAETRIVITHGTDTMEQTARVLGEADLNKTIVMTGAMVPYAVTQSDALFNLGFAMGVVQILPPGVYIAMNGCIHPWDNVMKDRERGIFTARTGNR